MACCILHNIATDAHLYLDLDGGDDYAHLWQKEMAHVQKTIQMAALHAVCWSCSVLFTMQCIRVYTRIKMVLITWIHYALQLIFTFSQLMLLFHIWFLPPHLYFFPLQRHFLLLQIHQILKQFDNLSKPNGGLWLTGIVRMNFSRIQQFFC